MSVTRTKEETKAAIMELMRELSEEDMTLMIYIMKNHDLLVYIGSKTEGLEQEDIKPFMVNAVKEHQAKYAGVANG